MARGMHTWGFSGLWVTLPSHGPSPARLGLGMNLFLQQETCGPPSPPSGILVEARGDQSNVLVRPPRPSAPERGGGGALASPRSSSPTLRLPAGRRASVWGDPTTP